MISVENVHLGAFNSGNNSLSLDLSNNGDTKRFFGLHIQTYTKGLGWGMPFFRELIPGEKATWTADFVLRDDPDAHSWLRLRFYSLESQEAFNFKEFQEERWYVGEHVQPYQPPSDVDSEDIPRLLFEKMLDLAAQGMSHRQSQYYDIYFESGSKAEADIQTITKERDSGVAAISERLGVSPGPRIRLILFADGEEKRRRTYHEGEGLAYRQNIIEIYNEDIKLDPFHEATHILSDKIGWPPAILREGLATYMSEYMGYLPLRGTSLSLYERVREIRETKEWIPLETLITFTEIGSRKSRPQVSYAEAGAFVKFLVDEFGTKNLLEAYRKMRSTDSEALNSENIRNLEEIYETSLQKLEEMWLKHVLIASKQ